VSQGKIEPLIDAARKQAIAQSQTELHEMIAKLEAQLSEAEYLVEQKIEQIQARLRKLEEGSTPKVSA